MAYTVEAIDKPVGTQTNAPSEFNLPEKVYSTYDPKTVQKSVAENSAPPAQNENAQQTGTGVAAPAAQSATAEESVALSPKIAAVARKEAAVRAREASIAQREKDLEARLKDAEAYKSARDKLAKKDFSAVEEMGGKYEDHTEYETRKAESADPREKRIQTLEATIENLKKDLEGRDQTDYESNQTLWLEEISNVVKSTPEFAAISRLKAEKAVLQHINDSFEEDNVKLTADQAIKDVLAEINRRKAAYDDAFKTENTPKNETAQATGKELGPPPKQEDVKTLTQNMTVTSRAQSKKSISQLPESEQLEEARRRWEAERVAKYGR